MIRENIGFCSKDLAQHNRIMFHEIWISLLTSLCPTLYISPLLSLIGYLVLQIMSYLWNEIQVRKHTPINPWKIKSVPTRLTDGTDFYIKYYVTLFPVVMEILPQLLHKISDFPGYLNNCDWYSVERKMSTVAMGKLFLMLKDLQLICSWKLLVGRFWI